MRHKIEGSRFDMRGGSQRAKEKSWGKRKKEGSEKEREQSAAGEKKSTEGETT